MFWLQFLSAAPLSYHFVFLGVFLILLSPLLIVIVCYLHIHVHSIFTNTNVLAYCFLSEDTLTLHTMYNTLIWCTKKLVTKAHSHNQCMVEIIIHCETFRSVY